MFDFLLDIRFSVGNSAGIRNQTALMEIGAKSNCDLRLSLFKSVVCRHQFNYSMLAQMLHELLKKHNM